MAKADAFKIRRVTIELGSDNSDSLTVEIHPGSQTATLCARWPSGEFRRLENMKLEDLVDQLRGLCRERETAPFNGKGYAVVTNDGAMVALTAPHTDAEVPTLLAHFDSKNPQGAPHRMARMVEAGKS